MILITDIIFQSGSMESQLMAKQKFIRILLSEMVQFSILLHQKNSDSKSAIRSTPKERTL